MPRPLRRNGIRPQLTQLVAKAPDGPDWLHEIKFDGYRLHARLDRGAVRLLTRTGLDWTGKYRAIAVAVASISAKQAYLDGELCGVFPDGITSFGKIQTASDAGNAAGLVYFIFDLLHLDGEDLCPRPLIARKARLAVLLSGVDQPLHYSDYHRGRGPAFHEQACKLALEGIVSKRADAFYTPSTTCAGYGSRPNASTARSLSLSAGPIRRAVAPISARCCSPITIVTGGSSTPAALAPASTPPSSSVCGTACSPWLPTECRSMCRRRAAAASARRWCSAACTGYAPSSSPR